MLTIVGVCIILLVHECKRMYLAIKNQERANAFAKMTDMDSEIDETDKNFIIAEQRKIIHRMHITNLYNQKIAEHYRDLYLWRESRKERKIL